MAWTLNSLSRLNLEQFYRFFKAFFGQTPIKIAVGWPSILIPVRGAFWATLKMHSRGGSRCIRSLLNRHLGLPRQCSFKTTRRVHAFEPGLLKPRSGSKVPGCSKNKSGADYPTVRFDKGFKNNYFKRLLIIRLFNEELWNEHFNRMSGDARRSTVSGSECQPRPAEILSTTDDARDEKNWVHRVSRETYGFSKNHRLTRKKEIDQLFQRGGFRSCGFLKFRYLPKPQGYIRVVISISKRVGNAPKRNRIKRLIRESLRTSGYLRKRSMDCAIYVTKPLQKKPTLEETQRYLVRFLGNLPDDYKS